MLAGTQYKLGTKNASKLANSEDTTCTSVWLTGGIPEPSGVQHQMFCADRTVWWLLEEL